MKKKLLQSFQHGRRAALNSANNNSQKARIYFYTAMFVVYNNSNARTHEDQTFAFHLHRQEPVLSVWPVLTNDSFCIDFPFFSISLSLKFAALTGYPATHNIIFTWVVTTLLIITIKYYCLSHNVVI